MKRLIIIIITAAICLLTFVQGFGQTRIEKDYGAVTVTSCPKNPGTHPDGPETSTADLDLIGYIDEANCFGRFAGSKNCIRLVVDENSPMPSVSYTCSLNVDLDVYYLEPEYIPYNPAVLNSTLDFTTVPVTAIKHFAETVTLLVEYNNKTTAANLKGFKNTDAFFFLENKFLLAASYSVQSSPYLSYLPTSPSLTISDLNLKLNLESTYKTVKEFDDAYELKITDEDVVNNELVLNWENGCNWAEEVDLEWTWIDYYEADDQTELGALDQYSVSFINNATRVTLNVNDNQYKIPLNYEQGYLVYRIRPVTYWGDDFSQRKEGKWNVNDEGSDLAELFLATTSTNHFFAVVGTDFEPNLNWVHQMAFAEEGKRKQVFTALDGLGKTRQAVTRTNTNNNAIVAETFYDKEGRPTVQAMPAPVISTETYATFPPTADHFYNPLVQFYPNFNLSATRTSGGEKLSYNWKDFYTTESSVDPCTPTTATAFAPDSGSGRYYSTNNTLFAASESERYQRYTPDAKGFPLSQVEYMPDATGRIRRQGGVGPQHQLGSGHETQYAYSVPEQVELARLFGSDVGDARHYKKNVVIDANGQATISFVNPSGQIIATTMIGDKPDNVEELAEASVTPEEFTADLLRFDANDLSENDLAKGEVTFSGTFSPTSDGEQSFNYELQASVFNSIPALEERMCGVCATCVYDIEIGVYSDCGKQIFKRTISSGTPEINFGTTCGAPDPLTAEIDETYNYEQGKTYHYYRTIRVNQTAMQTLWETVLAHESGEPATHCVLQAEDFYTAPSPTDCEEYCATDLESTPTFLGACDASLAMMLRDVSPGGQYAEFSIDAATNTIVFNDVQTLLPKNSEPINAPSISLLDEKNIYSVTTTTPSTINACNSWDPLPNVSPLWAVPPSNNLMPGCTTCVCYESFTETARSWRNPCPPYFNEDGTESKVNYLGTLLSPQDLPLEAFLHHWKPTWAFSLLIHHPEYPLYKYCIESSRFTEPFGSQSDFQEFDKLIADAETFDDFKTASGYTGAFDALDVFSYLQDHDPYFIELNNSTPSLSPPHLVDNYGAFLSDGGTTKTILTALNDYQLLATGGLSFSYVNVFQSVGMQLLCTSPPLLYDQSACLADVNTLLTALATTSAPTTLQTEQINKIWQQFKMVYISKKQTIFRKNQLNFVKFQPNPIFTAYSNTCIGTEVAGSGSEHCLPCSEVSFTINYSVDGGTPTSQTISQSEFYKHKTSRFPDPGVVTGVNENQTPEEATAVVAANMGDHCLSICTGYQEYWWRVLQDCPCLAEEVDEDGALKTAILEGFTAVCQAGCDVNSPLGASVLQNGINTGAPYYYTSFADVVKKRLGTCYNEDNVEKLSCDAILLSMPKAQGHDYLPSGSAEPETTATSPLDECNCSKLKEHYLEALNEVLEETPAGQAPDEDQVILVLTGAFNLLYSTEYDFCTMRKLVCACEELLNPVTLIQPLGGIRTITTSAQPTTGAILVGRSISQTTKGSVLIAGQYFDVGTSSSSLQLSRYLSDGKLAFSRVYSGVDGSPLSVKAKGENAYLLSNNPSAQTNTLSFINFKGQIEVASEYSSTVWQLADGAADYLGRLNITDAGEIFAVGAAPAGSGYSKPQITRFDNDGSQVWNKTIALARHGILTDVISADATHILAVGSDFDAASGSYTGPVAVTDGTINSTAEAALVVKTDLSGNVDWVKSLVPTNSDLTLLARKAIRFADDEFVVVCQGYNAAGAPFVAVFKIDDTGAIVAERYLELKKNSTDIYSARISAVKSGDDALVIYGYGFYTADGAALRVKLNRTGLSVDNAKQTLDPDGNIAYGYYSATTSGDKQLFAGVAFNLTTGGITNLIVRDGDELLAHQLAMAYQEPTVAVSNTTLSVSSAGLTLTPTNILTSVSVKDVGITHQPQQPVDEEEEETPPVSTPKDKPYFVLPEAISCPRCLTCEKLEMAMEAFAESKYAAINPCDPSDPNYYRYETVLQNFLNNYFNAHFNYRLDYRPYFRKCALFPFVIPVEGDESGDQNYVYANARFGLDDYPSVAADPAPTLCAYPILSYIDDEEEDDCCQPLEQQAEAFKNQLYTVYITKLKEDFENAYRRQCLSALSNERFEHTFKIKQYQYTLYYYDRAGNTIRTIPPAGVRPLAAADAQTLAEQQEKYYRKKIPANLPTAVYHPLHKLPTDYRYSSLGQLVENQSPDEGLTTMYYDLMGKLVVSQNAKQAANSAAHQYSYTKYDHLDRTIETGEILNANPITDDIVRDIAVDADPDHPAGRYIPEDYLNWLASATTRREVVQSFYDRLPDELTLPPNLTDQGYTQKRLVARSYTEGAFDPAHPERYNHAAYYAYDIHANVSALVQHHPALAVFETAADATQYHQYKKTEYQYDLISGNVHRVAYQSGRPDQLYHRYHYDADNRITQALLSHDAYQYNQQADYQYYRHGQLARTELGQHSVQGLDYLYTLHGWLKAVNGNTMQRAADPGRDGYPAAHNENVSVDAFGFTLNYYHDSYAAATDYKPVDTGLSPGGSAYFELSLNTSHFNNASPNLYNGNIKGMATAIRPLMSTGTEFANGAADPASNVPLAFAYNYDQLNRLINTRAFYTNESNSSPYKYQWRQSGSTLFLIDRYRQTFAYDPNGNILTQTRNNGHATLPTTIDNLTYHYNYDSDGDLINNQLNYVDDAGGQVLSSSDAAGRDLPDQSSANYTYDEIGNLIADASEGSAITWNVYRKVKTVDRTTSKLIFDYDGTGKRIAKTYIGNIVNESVGGGVYVYYGDTTRTHYIYDAGGNVLATYTRKTTRSKAIVSGYAKFTITDKLTLDEQHIYGSSRIGLYNVDTLLSERVLERYHNITNPPGTLISHDEKVYTGDNVYTLRGRMRYELSNHLGNVLVTVSDKKLKHNTEDHYYPDVINFTDYYAFGMAMPNRTGYVKMNSATPSVPATVTDNAGESYRYAFNGKEADRSEWNSGTVYDYGFRIYDSRLGKFLSVDPLKMKFPMLTPYQFASNTPIAAIDLDGLESTMSTVYDEKTGVTTITIVTEVAVVDMTSDNIVSKDPNSDYYFSKLASSKLKDATTAVNSDNPFNGAGDMKSQYEFTFSFKLITKEEYNADPDHTKYPVVMMFKDEVFSPNGKILKGRIKDIGDTDKNVIQISVKKRDEKDPKTLKLRETAKIQRTIFHELGHYFGLPHPGARAGEPDEDDHGNVDLDNIPDLEQKRHNGEKVNLMYPSIDTDKTVIEQEQRSTIRNRLKENMKKTKQENKKD